MLTAQGAQLLRDARDQILAHPEQFDMGEWECGTHACIGGWMCRLAGFTNSNTSDADVSEACGFGAEMENKWLLPDDHPLHDLFYEWPTAASRDVAVAAERINAFLLKYGYPADPFTVDLNDCSASALAVAAVDPVGELVTG